MAEIAALERPQHLVVVLGTATEVGKTWVTARLIGALRDRGMFVGARKPVQSFDPSSQEPTDARVLADASGEDRVVVCPDEHSYPVPMAPPMAAEVLGLALPSLVDLIAQFRWQGGLDVGIVETVGGVRSPLTAEADSRDVVHAVAAETVILVADASLGAVDAVRTSVDALDPQTPLVFLNRFDGADDLHRRNRDWLVDHDHLDVIVDLEVLADRIAARSEHGPDDSG